jgi:uncharacterized NAD-dependent epimerase/dehydratase family protein
VGTLEEAIRMGAEVLVLGLAVGGGLIPDSWKPAISRAVEAGLSIVNGLHERLSPLYPNLQPRQWIWDVRVEPADINVGNGVARGLPNKRILMVGTDMAVGKMTAGLEIYQSAKRRGLSVDFVATGQIGVTIMGRGVALDAVRLDYAAGVIEREVLTAQDKDLVIIEGQGSIIHPASSATLPLFRGACPTHLILCHRARQQSLYRAPRVRIPDLGCLIRLYEELGGACGAFPRPKTVGIALNTSHLSESEASSEIESVRQDIGLPCVDPVRQGASALLDALLVS